MTYTANVIVNHPARITLKSLEQRFAMLGRDPADIGQRAIDAGLLLVIGDGAPIPENCGARDWAKAHYNGEDALGPITVVYEGEAPGADIGGRCALVMKAVQKYMERPC